MRRLTWTKSLRATLLVAGFSLGANAVLDPSILRTTVVAAEDSAKEAATVEEAAKVLDLRTLPLPEGAVVTQGRHIGTVSYEVPADFKKAFQFQQQQLAKLGWKELPGSVNQATYSSANFQKSGFVVLVMCYPKSDPDKKGMSDVFIYNYGNVPMSKIPAMKGAKAQTVTPAIASYTTTLKSAEAVAATRKLLVDAGWEPYGGSKLPPDSEILVFKRNAIRLTAHVSAAPGNQAQCTYSLSLMAADIPAPSDADKINLNDLEKTLKFETAADFDAVAKFYRQRLAKQGWASKSEELFKRDNDSGQPVESLFFLNAAKDRLTLDLEKQAGKTHATIAHVTAAEFAESEKRQRAAVEKLVAENKGREDAEAKESAKVKGPAKKAVGGVPDVDALIKGAVGDALKDAGLDGKKPAKDAAKGNAADELRLKGLPIPEGASDISSMKQRGDVRFNVTSDFKTIGNFYAKQLGEQRWTKSGKDNLQQDFWVQTFAKDKMSLQVRVAKREGGSEVRLTPTGLLWDDDDQPSPKNLPIPKVGKDASVDGPARPEKAKKGIDKLPKLTSAAKVIVNGETIALPHVLAYEAVSGGEWVTRIVATDKPLKQETLIEQLKFPGENRDFDLPTTPWLRLELDHKDRPDAINLAVQKFQTGAGSRNFKGDAIVEDGRARGSIQTKEPVEFGGRTITAEITFDVPVLTRDSKLTKQLTEAPKPETSEPDKPKKGIAKLPKLENSGKLLVNDKPIKLGNVVAYELMVSGKKTTAINFTDKPINLSKLKALLAKDGSDMGLFDFDSQVKLELDQKNEISVILVAHDNDSLPIIGGSNVISDVIIEDSRARGTVKLGEPKKFSGKSYSLDLTFDVEVLKLPAT